MTGKLILGVIIGAAGLAAANYFFGFLPSKGK